MTVFAIYNVLDEVTNLPRAMDSVEENFDAVVHVVVDGKYPDYEGDSDVSTDGTRDIARDRGILITCIDYECEKRTAALRWIDDHAEDGDFALYLDADEEITQRFAMPRRVGYFSFSRASSGVTYGRCRLYRWELGLEFKHRHYELYDSKGELVSSLEDAPQFDTVGFGIHHDTSHDEARARVKRAYYKELREREGHPAAAR